ncbi:MAG: grasp-with-spasm system SPASM domain peptide maturase [Bacteroidota bacterium]
MPDIELNKALLGKGTNTALGFRIVQFNEVLMDEEACTKVEIYSKALNGIRFGHPFHKFISKTVNLNKLRVKVEDEREQEPEANESKRAAQPPAMGSYAPGDQYFYLFACCLPVKGFRRTLICDIGRQDYYIVPNSMHEFLKLCRKHTYGELKQLYADSTESLHQYLRFLLQEELGVFVDDLGRFPDIPNVWDHPSDITNAIIDAEASSDHDYPALFEALDELGCGALELRFFYDISLEKLRDILQHLKGHCSHAINIVLQHRPETTPEAYFELCQEHGRISTITAFGAPFSRQLKNTLFQHVDGMGQVFYTEEMITSEAHCGLIDPDLFLFDQQSFYEGKNFNSCLNRKISVDRKGDIKNCPSMLESYGHHREVTLQEVASQPAFRRYWGITKDQVSVCQDCEFRLVCSDCRAYTQEDDLYGKPMKCGFDPYTGTWAEAQSLSNHQPVSTTSA